jgi:dTDP-4-amino-4,6-dideoxygalactose transaminase
VHRPRASSRAEGMLGLTRLSPWPPLPPTVHLHRPGELPFPLQDEACRLFALGRHALWQGARALDLEPGDEILVPAYHHGSEVEALVEAGLACRFYGGGEDLQPTEPELDALVGPRTRALLLIHYLGFPQEAERWRRWCDAHDLLLIEDAAQAWLARGVGGAPIGSTGDLAIFCLYKTFGLPDGAALVSRRPPVQPATPVNLGAAATARRHWSWMKSRAPFARRRSRPREGFTTDEFELGDPATSACRATTFLLRRVATTDAAAMRRTNYMTLLERLQGRVPRPFDTLPDGAAPFAFPVETTHKDALLEALSRHAIDAFDFWSVAHPSLDEASFPAVRERRRRTIGLPVHQELRPKDVERIAAVVVKETERK